MLEQSITLNPGIRFYHMQDPAFRRYGTVRQDIDVQEFTRTGEDNPLPEAGMNYVPSLPEFKALWEASQIKETFFGQLPSQIGICWEHNYLLNALDHPADNPLVRVKNKWLIAHEPNHELYEQGTVVIR